MEAQVKERFNQIISSEQDKYYRFQLFYMEDFWIVSEVFISAVFIKAAETILKSFTSVREAIDWLDYCGCDVDELKEEMGLVDKDPFMDLD